MAGTADMEAAYNMAPKGWVCPVCGGGVSPYLQKCPCKKMVTVEPWKPVPPPRPPYQVEIDPTRPWPIVRYIDPPDPPQSPFINDATNRFP